MVLHPAADCDADDKRRSAGEPDDAPEIVRRLGTTHRTRDQRGRGGARNRRQTGLGIEIRWRVGVSLPLSGSRLNTTTESER
jgi:hypothetical protein